MKNWLDKVLEIIDLKNLISGVVLFGVIILVSIVVFKLPIIPKLSPGTKSIDINVPNLDKKGIEESKQKVERLNYDTKLSILDSPIETPPFVTDPERLKDYLGKVSRTIILTGDVEDAYLYIQSGDINIQTESIYFYIVDGKIAEGHLYPKDAISSVSDSTFVYDLKKLPLMKFPYSLTTPTKLEYVDVVTTLFNRQGQGIERKYYIGAFVSTTKLPNEIKAIEIRYKCKQSSTCNIVIQ